MTVLVASLFACVSADKPAANADTAADTDTGTQVGMFAFDGLTTCDGCGLLTIGDGEPETACW